MFGMSEDQRRTKTGTKHQVQEGGEERGWCTHQAAQGP